MLKELINLANHLDGKGFRKEADHLDSIVTKLASRGAIMDNWNYMNDPRTNAKSPYKGYNTRNRTLTIEWTDYNEDGEEVKKSLTLPAEMKVCDLCGGTGSHTNPSIDAGGISQEDFYDDPDFEEEYFSGTYDVPCAQCGGKNVIPVVNENALSKEQSEEYNKYVEDKREREREEYYDRQTRFYESGGYGW